VSTYQADTADTVEDAVKWASESAARNLGTYVGMVERAQDGTYTADQMTRDVAALTAGMQQDAARAFTIWSRMFTGLIK
jgi:hypothetical protein